MIFVSLKSLMKMGLFSFLVTLLTPTFSVAQGLPFSEVQISQWAQDPQWLRLLQYKKTWFGKYESAAKEGPFFTSPEGRTNPTAELTATLEFLLNPDKKITSKDQKFQDAGACVFPARKKWLEKVTGHKFASPDCERYERFLEILAPQSLTYVFSSYYLNNPASAFGHTFLRINKAPSSLDGQRYELSDYGVGYAALKVSDNPFVYSFLGLSGLMPGSFDINPYYYKVREYNDFESRDLWEYDLNFTPDEVQMAVAYIWELLNAEINYLYMSENCAYRILTIFEVARPGLDLISKLKTQVMPADTVSTVFKSENLVNDIQFRPSVRALFRARYQNLSAKAQNRVHEFSKTEKIESLKKDLSLEEHRKTFDTAMDYLDYQYPKEILNSTGHFFLKKEVLAERASLGGKSEVLKVEAPWAEAPHDAQGSRRIGFGARDWDHEDFYLLDMKLALHDLLDPKMGYPPHAEITMGHFGLSYNKKTDSLELDRALAYEVISLSPVDDFTSSPSWRLKVGVERGFENGCWRLCRWTEVSGGSGYTKSFFKNLDLSFWMRISGLTSSDFRADTWLIGAGPSVSLRWNQGPFALLAESYYRYDYRGSEKEFRIHTAGLNYSFNKNFSLRVQGEDVQEKQRLEGRLLWYY